MPGEKVMETQHLTGEQSSGDTGRADNPGLDEVPALRTPGDVAVAESQDVFDPSIDVLEQVDKEIPPVFRVVLDELDEVIDAAERMHDTYKDMAVNTSDAELPSNADEFAHRYLETKLRAISDKKKLLETLISARSSRKRTGGRGGSQSDEAAPDSAHPVIQNAQNVNVMMSRRDLIDAIKMSKESLRDLPDEVKASVITKALANGKKG